MAENLSFRSSLGGFNREDVVHYLEYINTKHQNQVQSLHSELEELRSLRDSETAQALTQLQEENAALAQQVSSAQEETGLLAERSAALLEENAALTQQIAALLAEKATLEEALEAARKAPAAQDDAPKFGVEAELETYRRAERLEREARERAELVYFQANGVLNEAAAKVDSATGEITEITDQILSQLTQLQMAVSSSKHVLQDAAAIMNTIRPNR